MAKAKSSGRVGSLFFGMTLDTKGFKKKLKEVRKTVKSIGKQIREDFKTMAKAGLLLGTAIAAAGVGMLLFAKRTLSATNAQLLLADSLGITQEEVAGLDLAAQKWGVSQDMLIDKMREFGGLDQFKKLAEDVKNAGDEQAQLNKAQEIFGNEGLKLLPILQQGAAGFAAMEAEAVRLGLALSPDQIRESRVVWEELESTLFSIKGLGKQVGAALLEPLGIAASGVKAFITTFKDDIIGGFKFVAGVITGFIKGAFKLFIDFGIPFINGFISFANQIGEVFQTLFSWLEPTSKSVFGGLASFFQTTIDFLATMKASLTFGISKAIEMTLRGFFDALSQFNNFVGGMIVEVAALLEQLGLEEEGFAGALGEAFGEQSAKIRGFGRDLAKPFVQAQKDSLKNITKTLIDQDRRNDVQREKFSGMLAKFELNFGATLTDAAQKTTKAIVNAARTISDKASGLVLSGSQAEQNIINQSQNKMLTVAQDTLKEQKKQTRFFAKLDTV